LKQIIQNLRTGETILEEVPSPQVGKGQLLIRTSKSLVSLGTEKMLVEFGKSNLIQKAKQQPEKVQMVLNKIKTEGLVPTVEAVFNKLGQPLPLGYCNVGQVIGIGQDVIGFQIGDRVASNGPHAEVVCVPQNLCALIPDNVTDEEATFTVIGSIGLQGVRLLSPDIGETVVVTGMGLIGLITAQLLIANGCTVIGLDIDNSKLEIAQKWGVIVCNPNESDPVALSLKVTNQGGVDGVIITASNKSDEIISQAANLCRKRGRIVLVGVIGLKLNRSDFYEKELTFQVSCSYGPGRYDDNYEQKGIDYPLPYVRWTEKRNFNAILKLIANRNLKVNDLIEEAVPLENFIEIYGDMSNNSAIANLLSYSLDEKVDSVVENYSAKITKANGKIAVIGAGNFTQMTMMPLLKNSPVKYIVSKGGLTARELSKKYNIPLASTDIKDALSDTEVSVVIISTRHDLHADMVLECLLAGKDVFVEKPLVINQDDIDRIIKAQAESQRSVTVGFNRRFSPHIQRIKQVVPASSAKNMVATMNAGFIPNNVWVQDMNVGGGRIIGEACHYFDLLVFISGSPIVAVNMSALGCHPELNTDNASILLKFANGDNGVINYFANGSKSYAKERLEVYFDQKTIVMDNFRETQFFGFKSVKNLKTRIDKGHKKQFELLSNLALKGGPALISFNEIINTTKASFASIESLKKSVWVDVG